MGLFTVGNPFPGTNANIRRALSQTDCDQPLFVKLRSAIAACKVKAESPIYFEDCWAHVGVRPKKIAVAMTATNAPRWIETMVPAWEAHGWRLLLIDKRRLQMASHEQLMASFKAILGGAK